MDFSGERCRFIMLQCYFYSSLRREYQAESCKNILIRLPACSFIHEHQSLWLHGSLRISNGLIACHYSRIFYHECRRWLFNSLFTFYCCMSCFITSAFVHPIRDFTVKCFYFYCLCSFKYFYFKIVWSTQDEDEVYKLKPLL